MKTKDLLLLFAYYTLLHIAVSPLAFGQQDPFEQQNHPEGDDLLARVTSENGEPVAGLHAVLEINRTVGFFSGSGTPPITSRTASNSKGELRFSNGTNWRDWIDAELTVQADNNKTSRKDFAEFTAFRWKLYGFWPQTSSRLELYSTGKPALWRNDDPISFVVLSLQKVRVFIKSRSDNKPLANVRLQFRREQNPQMQDHVWNDVYAYAWTDATGAAVVWLPKGDHRVLWDTTLAINGCLGPSELFTIQDMQFRDPPDQKPPRNAMVDQARLEAMRRRAFWFDHDQAPLRIGEKSPEIYELKLEAPLMVAP